MDRSTRHSTAQHSTAKHSEAKQNQRRDNPLNDLREGITRVGSKALEIMEGYFDGTRDGTDKVKEASRMISAAIKVEHMNQIAHFSEKSLALRLIQHLPKDEVLRAKYIQITNPQLVEMKLLDRPKK